jgi:hypothetical protein
MHMFPGLYYFEYIQDLWKTDFLDTYMQIIDTYQSQIIIILGAHIHCSDFRAPLSSSYPNINVVEYINPAVSPIYANNPAYTVLEVSHENGVDDMTWRFLQLYEYLFFKWVRFESMKPEEIFNVDFNEATTLQTFTDRIATNAQEFSKYMVAKMGFPWIF